MACQLFGVFEDKPYGETLKPERKTSRPIRLIRPTKARWCHGHAKECRVLQRTRQGGDRPGRWPP